MTTQLPLEGNRVLLQQGLALLTPGPHVQQLFLGFVTIGAVALDLALTKIRARRAA